MPRLGIAAAKIKHRAAVVDDGRVDDPCAVPRLLGFKDHVGGIKVKARQCLIKAKPGTFADNDDQFIKRCGGRWQSVTVADQPCIARAPNLADNAAKRSRTDDTCHPPIGCDMRKIIKRGCDRRCKPGRQIDILMRQHQPFGVAAINRCVIGQPCRGIALVTTQRQRAAGNIRRTRKALRKDRLIVDCGCNIEPCKGSRLCHRLSRAVSEIEQRPTVARLGKQLTARAQLRFVDKALSERDFFEAGNLHPRAFLDHPDKF